MDIFFEWLAYLLVFLTGALVLKYRKEVRNWSGEFQWAEKYLGRGGSYFFIILIGLFLCFYAVTAPFGVWDDLKRPNIEVGNPSQDN